jgi:hypothetical protein
MPTEFFNRLLDAEKTSYTDLMQQAEAKESVSNVLGKKGENAP